MNPLNAAPAFRLPQAIEADLAAGARTVRRLALPVLVLAAVPAAGLMAGSLAPGLVRGINPASADVLLALIALPMWLCLAIGFVGLVLQGRLDPYLGPRALQAPLALVAITALCTFSGRAATLNQPEPAWLAVVLPALAIGLGVALAWPRRGAGRPA